MSSLEKVSEFGKRYYSEYLVEYEKGLDSDIWEALNFFFSKTFYGGRRDELSAKYRKIAEELINEKKNLLENNWKKGNIWDKHEMRKELKDRGVSKGADRKMVGETLEFISDKNACDHNIVRYSKELIKSGKVEELFNQIDDIHNIGKKKASFYIRDVVDLFNLDKHIKKEEYIYLQPVDTWVHQVAKSFDILDSEKPSWGTDSKKIVDKCLTGEVSPIKFNQGAWYIGKNSLSVALENLNL